MKMFKPALLAILLGTVLLSAAPEPIRLWPGAAPGESEALPPELNVTQPGDRLIAGKPVLRIGNVGDPTLTIHSPPEGTNTGAAVLVFPGGGYNYLAYDAEGVEVCEWLNSIGVTGVLVKYRVPRRPGIPQHVPPLQDAQRAMGLLRAHAAEYGIDSDKIGVIGFSAGAHVSAVLSNNHSGRAYPRVDTADDMSCRPDFAMLIYPGYIAIAEKDFAPAPETALKDPPPTFIVMAQDDPVHVENALLYYMELQKAGVSAEMHLYARGGHGFALRRSELPASTWPARAADWLHAEIMAGRN